MSISKSYQRLRQRDVVTGPKTAKGNRVIQLPQFLCDEMRAFLGTFYSLDPADRIFTMTKYSISHRLETGAAEAGVKRIRVHDGCIKIGLNQKQPHSKGHTDLVLF